MLELDHLHAFLTLAEELHFGRAAKRLRIAQPALSQQLQRLEARLGVVLIDRTSRRSVLTDAGRALVSSARALLSDAERTESLVKRAALGEIGVLRIAFIPSGAFGLLPDIVSRFTKRFPDVSLEFVDGPLEAPVDRLHTGAVDVAVVREPVPESRLTAELLHSEAICAVLPATHPLARRRTISLKALRDENFVMFPRARSPQFHDALLGLCRRAGITPRIVHEAADWQVIASLVAAGVGVTLAPESVRRIGRDGVRFISLDNADRIAKLWFLYSKERESIITQQFITIARESLAARPGRAAPAAQTLTGKPTRAR